MRLKAKILLALLLVFFTPVWSEGLVTLAPGLTDMVLALEEGGVLAGVTDYCVIPEGLTPVSVGTALSPSREKIISLEPDMVFLYGESKETMGFLDKAGIKYMAFPHKTFSDIYFSLEQMGKYFGKERLASEAVSKMRLELAEMKKETRNGTKRVLIIVGREPGSLKNIYILGHGDFLWELLDYLGCENAYEGNLQYPRIGYESLFTLDPDMIIEILPDLAKVYGAARLQGDWKMASGLRAVKNGNVRTAPPGTRVEPSTSVVELGKTLKELIYAD